MLSRLDLRGAGPGSIARLPRPASAAEPPVEEVQALVAEVRDGGDGALRRLTERFDGVAIDDVAVPAGEIEAALEAIAPELRRALEVAHANIVDYHRAQVGPEVVHQRNGISVTELRRAVERVGLYVPSAGAPLISTVLMTAVPAKVAGVATTALCSAPGPDGRVPAGILAAAALSGVDEVYRVGGVQAIAALAYGTESIRPVDVIVGPGGNRVAQAKREVASRGVVGVPSSFAGPSEVVVVADSSVPVAWAAVDVVVQAEHGPDGLAWLVTWDEAVATAVSEAVARIVESSPRRSQITATLAGGGYAVVVDGPEQAMAVANAIAPEHLQLMVEDPGALLARVTTAGAVFCGPWAPASVGDYLAGPSHVLPTYGSARFASALRVDDFVKHIHVVDLDGDALARAGPHVAALARAEGLAAHAQSVELRMGDGARETAAGRR
ncbi:MAG TPA: histidinol dehydrogenase [Acidimicrobiales bacterium]|nr:histidinol dehydrogenase [Acidimicrobiales bacterium]